MESLLTVLTIIIGGLLATSIGSVGKVISTKDESVLHLREGFLNAIHSATAPLKPHSDVVVIARYRGTSAKYDKFRVEQVWSENFNGGLVPYQRIRVKKITSHCHDLIKEQSYFLLLKKRKGRRVLVEKERSLCPVHHDYRSSDAIHFEEQVNSGMCSRRKPKHCGGVKLATGRYKDELTFFVGRNVTIVCPAMLNQNVDWFSREKNWAAAGGGARWQPTQQHMEGLMKVEGRILSPMATLQLAHSDVEYKCQVGNDELKTKHALFTLKVALPKDVVTPCGQKVCHNGGKCSHNVCRCTYGYYGRECTLKYHVKRRIF